jgi:UDP-sugar transporter A1/2/3
MDEYFQKPRAKAMLLLVAVVLMCANIFVGELAWRHGDFDPAFIIGTSELMKLGISITLYRKDMKDQQLESALGKTLTFKFWYDNRMFGIPAFIYFFLNNATIFAVKYLTSHMINMLSNLRLIITAGLAVAYLKQKVSKVQWMAVIFVTAGIGIISFKPGKKANEEKETSILLTLLFGVFSAVSSAVAGVYCEHLYKTETGDLAEDNVHIRNVKLYVFGVIFNAFPLIFSGVKTGLTWVVVLLIMLSGFQGLAMGFIMKYLDNVIRGIAIACASVLSTFFSVVILDNELTGNFVVGGLVILVSAHMYREYPVPKDTAYAPVSNEGAEDEQFDEEEGGRSKVTAESTPVAMPYKHITILVPLVLFTCFGMIPALDDWLHAAKLGP